MDDKSAAAGIGATNGFAGHLDDRNPQRDYARSDFDVGQRFVASYVYNLPVGTGKRFLGNISRPANAAIGGGSITGIGTFQKGFSFSVQANDKFGLLSAYNQRANVVSNPNAGFTKSINQWFNTAAFTQPGAGQFGNSSRNTLSGARQKQLGHGRNESVSLLERGNLQLRLESFNTFNHVQYGVDPTSASASAGSPGTGAIDRNVNDQAALGSTNTNFGEVISARPGRAFSSAQKSPSNPAGLLFGVAHHRKWRTAFPL